MSGQSAVAIEPADHSIAVVSSQGLGDGFLQLVLAQNLARSGHRVYFYQDHMAQLKPILKGVVVRPYLSSRLMRSEVANHTLVLFDQGSQFANTIVADLTKLPANFIAYSVSRSANKFPLSTADFHAYLHEVGADDLSFFAGFNRSIRHPINHRLSISEHFQWCAEKVLFMNSYWPHPEFDVPQNWTKIRFPRRVIIHPTSSAEKKNWAPNAFCELAERLAGLGWEPCFTVSPDEWPVWRALLPKPFLAPPLSSTLALARYYYESAAFIGNDSGNGHLASAMGLPTLSIFNRWKLSYPWRPGWNTGSVVAPWMPESLVGDQWSRYLSVDRVLLAFERLLERHMRRL